MKQQTTLESKELREIVACALKIPMEIVIQQRYSIAIEGISTEEVAKRIELLKKGEEINPL